MRVDAVHEAAHAAAAWALGWELVHISADEKAAFVLPREAEPLTEALERLVVAQAAAETVIELVAVPPWDDDETARLQFAFFTQPVRNGDEPEPEDSDRRQVERDSAQVTGSKAEQDALVAFARERARNLARDPVFQAQVRHLARLLDEHGEISGPVAATELSRAQWAHTNQKEAA